MTSYFIGLDLGQTHDPTALVLLEKKPKEPVPLVLPGWGWSRNDPLPAPPLPDPPLAVRHLQRYPLNTPYPSIVADVSARLARPPLADNTTLIIDGSGVGRPVVDLFRAKLSVEPVTITASGAAHRTDDGYWHIAKRDLIGAVQVLLQTGRLKIAATLPNVTELLRELQDYRVLITASANTTYEARSGAYDDLVLALALAAYWAEERDSEGVYF